MKAQRPQIGGVFQRTKRLISHGAVCALVRRCQLAVLNRLASTKKPALPPALSLIVLPRKSMRGVERGFFLPGDRAFHGRLHLLESADLDLPHAFARYPEFGD